MKRTVALVVLTFIGWGLAGCGGGSGSQAACKAAIQAQWNEALGNPTSGTVGTKPAACHGLSDAVINQLATEVMSTPVAD